jgi:anion-transporting  ArsA/GET3 family ATPase
VGEPDLDHSPLGALFGHPTLPKEPTELEENIYGVMIWARMGHERFLRSVLPIPALVKAALRSGALRRMLDAAPSLNELGVFYHMLSLAREQQGDRPRFDLIVIDLPATGHALGMATLPENILSIIPSGPIHRAMHEGMDIYFNPEKSAMYVVTLPEALPVTECVELLEGLKETEMPIGGVIVNKVFTDTFSEAERASLQPMMENNQVFGTTRYLGITKVKDALTSLQELVAVPTIQLSEHPIEGMELVERMAAELSAGGPS